MGRRRRQPALPDSIIIPKFRFRHLVLTILAIILTTGVVCERSLQGTAQEDDRTRYHGRTFKVARVIDGDTLDIAIPDGDKPVTRIRLWGVDTPETGRGKRGPMYFGPESATFAEETLAGRNVYVVLSPKRTRGRYKRLLAYLYLERGGPMFNEMLLEQGYAYADLRFPHHYSKQFKAIEKRARRAGIGLWAEVTLDRMPEWKQRFERRKADSGN